MTTDPFAPYVKIEDTSYLDTTPGLGRFAGSESYFALLWRKFRRSVTGMIGLCLVGLLAFGAIFADFVAPVEPKTPFTAFAPPDRIGFNPWPVTYPQKEGTELDPITFQPLIGPDYDNPRAIGFFVDGYEYKLLGLIPSLSRQRKHQQRRTERRQTTSTLQRRTEPQPSNTVATMAQHSDRREQHSERREIPEVPPRCRRIEAAHRKIAWPVGFAAANPLAMSQPPCSTGTTNAPRSLGCRGRPLRRVLARTP